MIHFLVASQAIALVFFFLPTLYSAYHFGRRHATLTACASVCVVVLLTYSIPPCSIAGSDYMPSTAAGLTSQFGAECWW